MSALNEQEKVLQRQLEKKFAAIKKEEGLKVVEENWTPGLMRRAAAFHIKHEYDPELKFTTYEELHDLVVRYFAWLNKRKPCNYTSKRRAGSMHRLMRYIDLKRELAAPGMQLTAWSAPPRRHPFADEEVVELHLSFAVKQGSEHHRLFDVNDLPPHIKPWLEQVVGALGDDEAPRFSETFSADMKRHPSIDSWKAEKFMGYPKAAEELLEGFSPVAEAQPLDIRYGDPVLVILDPDIPPKELGRIYDNMYVTHKANAKNYRLWRDAMNTAQADFDALTADDFMTYFWQHAPELLESDRPPQGYTEEAMGEQLRAYLPQLIDTFREEKLRELQDKHQRALEPEEVEARIREQTGSTKRPPPPSLDQEILGRMAFDVCLEGLYFDDDNDNNYLMAVWRKYRMWVESLGDQAKALEVDPNYYNKPGEVTPNIQKIRTNLYRVEDSIAMRVKRPSPFRRALHPPDLSWE